MEIPQNPKIKNIFKHLTPLRLFRHNPKPLQSFLRNFPDRPLEFNVLFEIKILSIVFQVLVDVCLLGQNRRFWFMEKVFEIHDDFRSVGGEVVVHGGMEGSVDLIE